MKFRIVSVLMVCCPTNLCFRESSQEQGDPPEPRPNASALELTSPQSKQDHKPRKSSTERFRGKYTITMNEPDSEKSKVLYSPANRLQRQQRHWTQVENSTLDTLKPTKEEADEVY